MSCPSLIMVSVEERNHLLKEVEQLKHSSSTKSVFIKTQYDQYDGAAAPEKLIVWYLPTALQDQDLRCRVSV